MIFITHGFSLLSSGISPVLSYFDLLIIFMAIFVIFDIILRASKRVVEAF